jgi:hypothetical protein
MKLVELGGCGFKLGRVARAKVEDGRTAPPDYHQCGSDYDSSGRSDGGNYGPQVVYYWSGLENGNRAVSMGAVAGSYL